MALAESDFAQRRPEYRYDLDWVEPGHVGAQRLIDDRVVATASILRGDGGWVLGVSEERIC